MVLSSTITFGSLTLDGGSQGNYIESLDEAKVQGSIKQRFNDVVIVQEIPGRAKEWLLTINGVLAGSTRDANKVTLIGYDNGSVRNLTDGEHDGNYVVLSVVFRKRNNPKTVYPYQLTIRQYTQTLP